MSTSFRVPPGTRAWTIAGARVPACLLAAPAGPPDGEGLVTVDIAVTDERIAAVSTPGAIASAPGTPVLHAPGLVVPCFVDAHTHLDKGQIWPRAKNADGSVAGARHAVPLDREAHWSAADVAARMEFALRMAYAHGTRAIRTHLDSVGKQTCISYPVFAATRERWAGRIDLQASPLFGAELMLDEAHRRDVVAMVGAFGRCLGAVTYPGPDLQAGLDILFRLAADNGWDLDFHADETIDPTVNTLALIAETALAIGFRHRVLVGHCCTLSLMPDADRARTIDRVAKAGLSIVSLPMCNMYLQDRDDPARTPRWRGITAIKELKAAGVPVMIASDNTRDPFYAYGDLDMLEVWREGTRIAHLDHPFGDWPQVASTLPARAIGLDTPGTIGAGMPADLVVLPVRSLSELMARPRLDRIVIRGGQSIDTALPAYGDLDHLEGLRP
jgi:cytosine deaminase